MARIQRNHFFDRQFFTSDTFTRHGALLIIKVYIFYTLSIFSTITPHRRHFANKNYFHLFIPCAI
ncbi:hypothetical protein DUQ00_10460 [Salmonella bongori]|uniref:Uncharacterized protein n=1 Tax=Salmonella bongori TaxID=54736 RepID=A0A8F8AU07_SALBN|nr:hypothetical protein [Salmonella bongori]ECG8258076.1 hypothetical protein [Salmonella bongori serovar 48:i:-]EGE4653873.1 hypothetical protein [Salmonella bongori serovar 40:z35:- str. 95-0123]EGE4658644.1 hypothetical protein [Salmonella bongori serovar 48:i:- str. 94-0708]ECC9596742.1 hypothetical protein [Salmonella bongori]